ncbi:hypothetical protein BC938DRAFT_483632, partial [Jimgerdemannia flammicorona]
GDSETGKEKADNDNPSNDQSVPVSLEELIAKEEAEKREAEKPKFFTKEERAKLALEKRQQEVEELWRKQEQERHVRDEFDMKAMEEARNHYNGATGETATIASNTSNVISAVRGIVMGRD